MLLDFDGVVLPDDGGGVVVPVDPDLTHLLPSTT